jgi:hypothetical protein
MGFFITLFCDANNLHYTFPRPVQLDGYEVGLLRLCLPTVSDAGDFMFLTSSALEPQHGTVALPCLIALPSSSSKFEASVVQYNRLLSNTAFSQLSLLLLNEKYEKITFTSTKGEGKALVVLHFRKL